MPTAIDAVVEPEEAATPPTTSTNKKESRKITPTEAAKTAPKKQATTNKAQPSITSFFKQSTGKNLFSKTPAKSAVSGAVSSTKTSNTSKTAATKGEAATLSTAAVPTSSTIKDDSSKAATVKRTTAQAPTTPEPNRRSNIFSGRPSKADLMDIVFGSTVPKDDEEMDLPPLPRNLILTNPGFKNLKYSPSTSPVATTTDTPAAPENTKSAEDVIATETKPTADEDDKTESVKPKSCSDKPEPTKAQESSAAKVPNAMDKDTDDVVTPMQCEEVDAPPSLDGHENGNGDAINEETVDAIMVEPSVDDATEAGDEKTEEREETEESNARMDCEVLEDKAAEPEAASTDDAPENGDKESMDSVDLSKDNAVKSVSDKQSGEGVKSTSSADKASEVGDKEPRSHTCRLLSQNDTSMDCVDSTKLETLKPASEAKKTSSEVATKPSSAKKAKAPAKTNVTSPKGSKPVPELSAERQSTLTKQETLRAQYATRLQELVNQAREGLNEEKFQLPSPAPSSGQGSASPTNEFPDFAIGSLALVVQESQLSLPDLAATALIQLRDSFPDVEFSTESVLSKIKLLATRESYVQTLDSHSVNAFEDDNLDRMWRWEIISLDLLPADFVGKVKKARTARKKLRAHSKALCLLLKNLDQAKSLLQDPASSQTKCDAILTKISNAEEKVLKYERDAEKVRLAAESKKKKEEDKARKQEEKQKEKAEANEKKKREAAEAKEQKKKQAAEAKEQKKKEKELKKQQREELKRKKEAEKQKEDEDKERKLKKQRTMMMSFFSHQATDPKPPAEEPKAVTAASTTDAVDSDKFWSLINASERNENGPPFSKLSERALASRTRRTRRVPVEVFRTVMPEGDGFAFSAQPYREKQTVRLPNKFKFLSFHEDYRPPYHGTWSKTSSLVTGRTPFGKDTAYLDYEVDSEAEWEEGDCEIGEDVEDDTGDDDEDMMEEEEEVDASFIAAEDDLGLQDEEIDEETKLLRKKKLQAVQDDKDNVIHASVCIIAPRPGGLPIVDSPDVMAGVDELIEGVSRSEALNLLSSHTGQVLRSEAPRLDAFPPPLVEEGNLDVSSPSGGRPSSSSEMSRDDLITFVRFVHHCSLPSKDKLVEELRTVHKNITASRAQATRKLDSVAEKKRNPNGGVYWEVRREILEELGLDELLKMQIKAPSKPPNDAKPASAKKGTPSTKKSTASAKKSPKTPAPSKAAATKSSEKGSSTKKRPAPDVSSASAKLFAGFLKKKAKTETK